MALAQLPEGERKAALMELTELGMALGRTKETLDCPKGVRLLDMPPGRRSVQEFFYYFVMKLFYNPALTLERHYVNNLNAFGHEHVLHLPESEILAILVELGYDLELWNPRGNGVAIIAVRTGLSEQEAARSC
jgi:arsenite methyltransferase